MPLTVLLAIFVAFWSPTSPIGEAAASLSRPESSTSRAVLSMGVVGLFGLLSAVSGLVVAHRIIRRGLRPGDRKGLSRAASVLDWTALAAFAATIHLLDWPEIVEDALGLRGWVVLDEAAMLGPYLLMLLLQWVGLYPAERLLKLAGLRFPSYGNLFGYVLLKARRSLGLVIPVALLFAVVQDLDVRYRPTDASGAWVQLCLYAGLGVAVLVLSPAFVRLSWPSSPMPPGPLRDRLERLADRFGFRYSDILVWDTGGAMVNAGVTGALPWFRYVLLSDAMVEHLEPRQIEAVFGHEVGHIAHRHLAFFGLFFLGTIGVMALLSTGIFAFLSIDSAYWFFGDDPNVERIVQGGAALVIAALYFLLVFGVLSRRFERQADVYGCRVVSCGRPICPPHPDVNALPKKFPKGSRTLCPVGIGIFIEALSRVAILNGMEPRAASWRHGSIARRITFLRTLEGRPEAERRFQVGVVGLRLMLGAALAAALLVAIRSGAMESLQ